MRLYRRMWYHGLLSHEEPWSLTSMKGCKQFEPGVEFQHIYRGTGFAYQSGVFVVGMCKRFEPGVECQHIYLGTGSAY